MTNLKMHDTPVTRATVLISGEGSNLQAIIDATSSKLEYIKIVRVISNRVNAKGLNRARAVKIPTTYHNLISGKYYSRNEQCEAVKRAGRESYDTDLATIVLADKPDIVICAGFMHILTPKFLNPMVDEKIPVINLHPALYGKYDGTNAIERAYNDFQLGKLENNRTGIMVHYVISEVDRGDPIIQKEVECRKLESLKELEKRMHDIEHHIIIEGVATAVEELWKKRLIK